MGYEVSEQDRQILRELAKKQLFYANQECNLRRREEWYRHNELQGQRPMIHLEVGTFEQEILPDRMRCTGEFARQMERTLYCNFLNQELFDDDRVTPDYYGVGYDSYFTLFGLPVKVQGTKDAEGNASVGHHFVSQIQDLEEDWEEELPQLCQIYGEEFPLLDPAALPDRGEALLRCLEILEDCEILNREWRDLLTRGREEACAFPQSPLPELQARRAGGYFLYRHWLRAVWDGDLVSWAEFAVLGVAVTALLAGFREGGFHGVFRLFCEELEHNAENLDRLQTAFREELTLAQLLAVAGM